MKLVDTSCWIEYLRERGSAIGDSVETLILAGEAAWCDMTLVELWHGVRGAKEKKTLAEMETEIELIPVNRDVWQAASTLALCARERGFTIPASDIIIAACATTHGLELEHCDKHFDVLLPIAKSMG